MTLAIFPPPSITVGVTVSAQATLPLIELDRTQVERRYARVRPLPLARATLRFSAWKLYQAGKKAELACSFTSDFIERVALCFANEHHGLFDWSGGELRLNQGVTDMYETAAQASRARLIGEGMLLLAMQHEGYVFWDRLDLLVKRAIRKTMLDHPESVRRARAITQQFDANKQGKRSDFVIENSERETALAESKGSFVSPCAMSDVKTDLKDALGQLCASKPLIAPQPKKSYAVGTYLRELGDPHDEGS